jgi:hypothetical protein
MRAKAARIGDPVRLRAGLSCPRPRGAGLLTACTIVTTRASVLTQTLQRRAALQDVGVPTNQFVFALSGVVI